MKQIWLVRHGESKAQSGEDSDGCDPELSDLGRKQAKRLIAPLRDIIFDQILVSPLKRAWQTFEFSLAKGRRVEYDSRVVEADWESSGFYDRILPLDHAGMVSPLC